MSRDVSPSRPSFIMGTAMDIIGLETALRAQFEPLHYVLFIAALVVLGGLETVVALDRDRAAHRRRWPANVGLTALNLVVLGAMPIGTLLAADYAMARGWGLLNQPFVSPLAALAIGIVLQSLFAYGLHFGLHKVAPLWRIHRIHHSDTRIDISTTIRIHPLEVALTVPVMFALTIAGGLPPLAVLLYVLFEAVMGVFTHANITLPVAADRWLRRLVVTPAMHRLHHSARPHETDSNFGDTFSFWDRLFGTYRAVAADELAAVPLGLAECRDRRADQLWWLLCLPFRAQIRPIATADGGNPTPRGDG
jgi:sterol desaturase/sphingolipid hydroxylase (fatty acid hydroxylase superfamily)